MQHSASPEAKHPIHQQRGREMQVAAGGGARYLGSMSPLEDNVPPSILGLYEVHEWRHASAVLAHDFPNEWKDIGEVLGGFRLRKSAIAVGGGNKSDVSREIDSRFYKRGWEEKHFDTK